MSSQNVLPISAPSGGDDTNSDGYKAPLTFQQAWQAEDQQLGGDGKQRTALCISGGGIRSATFALGALQGLADLGILENFDYLSTVSGGGYIGSWLTAWKQRKAGLKNMIPSLKPNPAPRQADEPDPIGHLREYNNYLSPKLGLFSADTWTLVATVVRNMILNWLVFIPLLMFALMVPRIVLSLARLGEVYKSAYRPAIVDMMDYLNNHDVLPMIGGLLFAIGIFNVLRYLPSVGNKDHTEGDFLKYVLAPLFLAAVALLTMDAWFTGGDKHNPPTTSFRQLLLAMTGSGVAGWLAYLLFNLKKMWGQWRLIAGLTVAILLTVFSLAGAFWLLTAGQFRYLDWPVYITLAMPLLLLSFALAVTLFVGFTSNVLADEDREWLARAGAWMLLSIVIWAGFCTLALLAPGWAVELRAKAASILGAAGGLSGVMAALAGLSSKTKAQKNTTEGSGDDKKGMLMDLAGKLAAPVFIVVFLTCLALLTNLILWNTGRVTRHAHHAQVQPVQPPAGPSSASQSGAATVNTAGYVTAVSGAQENTTQRGESKPRVVWESVHWKEHGSFLEHTRSEDAIILALIFLLFSWIMSHFININRFSLQAMYRSRLIRAYLGASNKESHTNPFTGFADNDNFYMGELAAHLKPFHIVNITLNLVSGERLAWQQRKAESFTVSPLHCGYGDSFRPSKNYAGDRGISLGTAVAISGAAASPNMGYHSDPAMAFIMTLFNARLGSWLGNPKQNKWTDEGPKSAFDSIVREAFGLTNDRSPYVYLSDGGHFENLALYEMIHRRCRYIVVLDGGADPKFGYEDLGNALRKIRIDMNVTIEFEEPYLKPLEKPQYRCAVAKIHYPEGLTGELVYIKPVVLGTEPPDVTAYKAADDDFPHQSTGDQWFDESQTESYRMLGLCSVWDVFKQHWDPAKGFGAAFDHAREYAQKRKAAAATAAGKA